ncbi:MAG: hypothetical protein JWN56_1418 [Sphingobacteriales bacterium]|nr:hypothetical protein [Sphingobacteriales bacterium]
MNFKRFFLGRIFNRFTALLNINTDLYQISQRLLEINKQVKENKEDLDSIKSLLGKSLINNNINKDYFSDIQKAEFKIFSQWGDDGIIQYIINKLEFRTKTFIEFGVENYTESNSRFLLINDNWSGLVIDGSEQNIKYIQNDPIFWKYNLQAVQSFVTKNNINQIITSAGFTGEIGILSIDIDGNDYWIWETISVIKPVMVIIEFNAVFGIDRPITIPYSKNFIRQEAHYSYLYFGASLSALVRLAILKGYTFIGTNSASVNAYFIKNEDLGQFVKRNVDEAFSISKFRESRANNAALNYLSYQDSQDCIRGLPVYNIESEELELF